MNVKKLTLSAAVAAVLVLALPKTLPYLDFTLSYWHPSHELLRGGNPYSSCDLACLAQSVDADSLRRLNPAHMHVMYNPAVFAVFFPWAVLPHRVAVPLFVFAMFFFVGVAFQLLAEFLTEGRQLAAKGPLFWSLAVPVGVILQAVAWGAPGWISFVGVVLFMVFLDRRPFLAGLCASLTLVKIHLFLIFWAAVLGFCLRNRNWLAPVGALSAASVSLLIALGFRPDILTIYSDMVREGRAFEWVNATVPSMGRHLLNLSGARYLLGPCLVIGAAVFVYFWVGNGAHLRQKLCSLLPFSIGFAPYAWGHDYLSAMPVLVVCAIYAIDPANRPTRRKAMGACLLALNLLALVVAFIAIRSVILQLMYGVGVMALGGIAFRLSVGRGSFVEKRAATAAL